MLDVFGHDAQPQAVGGVHDTSYINWLLMVRAGLTGLEFFTPETKGWRQVRTCLFLWGHERLACCCVPAAYRVPRAVYLLLTMCCVLLADYRVPRAACCLRIAAQLYCWECTQFFA